MDLAGNADIAPHVQPNDEAENEQQDYTYNDLHSDTALHSYQPPTAANSVAQSGQSLNSNFQSTQPVMLHSASPPESEMPIVNNSPENTESQPANQNPLPPMGYTEQNQNSYFQPNFAPTENALSQVPASVPISNRMSELKGENQAEYAEIAPHEVSPQQQELGEPANVIPQTQYYTATSNSLKPPANQAPYFAAESTNQTDGRPAPRSSQTDPNFDEPRRSRADTERSESTTTSATPQIPTRPPPRASNEIERTTRPPLDPTKNRPDMRDPNTRAPIIPYDQDPTPFNKLPAENLEQTRSNAKSNHSIHSIGNYKNLRNAFFTNLYIYDFNDFEKTA